MTPGRVYDLEQLSQPDLLGLTMERTVALWTISPIEVHGPHLPLGTDVRIAELVVRGVAQRWVERRADWTSVILPPLCVGADVLPLPGSLPVRMSSLERMIVECGRGLARAGFRWLVLGNNHGGPRHLIALEAAARRLERETELVVLNPSGAQMSAALAGAQDPPGLSDAPTSGDNDVHAGRHETSQALYAFGEAVDPGYLELPPTAIAGSSSLGRGLRWLAGSLRRRTGRSARRAREASRGLDYAALLLDWMAAREMPSYLGAPALATAEQGAESLESAVTFTLDLLERAVAGEDLRPISRPPLWDLRGLAQIPVGDD